jgi:hypothetical protein
MDAATTTDDVRLELIEAQRQEIEWLRAALEAFAKHFGPLEDNHMLHPEARQCFKLARTALSASADSQEAVSRPYNLGNG